MKKILVASSMLLSIVGAAQQKDVFDVEKWLEKKISKGVTPKSGTIQSVPISNFYTPNKNIVSLLPNFTALANADKLIVLPQDNMPCIVPMQQQYFMPNGFAKLPSSHLLDKNSFPGKIPNAAGSFSR